MDYQPKTVDIGMNSMALGPYAIALGNGVVAQGEIRIGLPCKLTDLGLTPVEQVQARAYLSSEAFYAHLEYFEDHYGSPAMAPVYRWLIHLLL